MKTIAIPLEEARRNQRKAMVALAIGGLSSILAVIAIGVVLVKGLEAESIKLKTKNRRLIEENQVLQQQNLLGQQKQQFLEQQNEILKLIAETEAIKTRNQDKVQTSFPVIVLVNSWLKSKQSIFGPPFDTQLAARLLTGKAYKKWIEGSVKWLKKNNAYYIYQFQNLDRVESVFVNQRQAIITVYITEGRTFCLKTVSTDKKNTTYEQRRVSYILQSEHGEWKISDYKTKLIWQKNNPEKPEKICQTEEVLPPAIASYRRKTNLEEMAQK